MANGIYYRECVMNSGRGGMTMGLCQTSAIKIDRFEKDNSRSLHKMTSVCFAAIQIEKVCADCAIDCLAKSNVVDLWF